MIGICAITFAYLLTIGAFALTKVSGIMPISSLWLLAAQLSGISGLFFLSVTYLLATRLKILTTLFGGFDRLYKIHHITGGVAFLFLIHHPLFLVLNRLPTNTVALYFLPNANLTYTLGICAFYIMALLLVITIFVDLPYALWKQTHEWMGIVILLGGAHSLLVPSDIQRHPWFAVWMMMWVVIALASFIYKRYMYYLLPPHHHCEVVACEVEHDLLFLTLKDVETASMYRPGQFGFLSIQGHRPAREEHPFSIMRIQQDTLTLGIKIVGPFTLKLTKLEPGESVTLRGPYGSFGERVATAPSQVWIAGGIGITPFVSFLQRITANQRVTLYYCFRKNPGTIIEKLLVEYAKAHPLFTYIPVDTSTQSRLQASQILATTNIDVTKTTLFLCGPTPMMHALHTDFHALGMPNKHIIYEDFALK